MNILITTAPFGKENITPIQLLDKENAKYFINPYGRKLSEKELIDLVPEFDIIIAGTEKIGIDVFNAARSLKLISRVGVGLDGIDLVAAKKNNVLISYTPDAPAPAVAELTLGLTYSLIRNIHMANVDMHRSLWKRYFGKRLCDCKIGIIGVGRIGNKVANLYAANGAQTILLNDLKVDQDKFNKFQWVDKEIIYKDADIITLHLPYTNITKDLIGAKELSMMKPEAVIINTARGGIINENALIQALKDKMIHGAAIDVFENEPYVGELSQLDNCILTAHMGSMSKDCRAKMEIEATEEAIRYLRGDPLKNLIPDFYFQSDLVHE
ncbi:NAD(P)-dependent oxidoreductase [Polynucleobacter sp. AP-Ainpum-60-G11]|uniref:NAD(P)-dependent oxidoreductase n=1 Tax=Polynucleobacter sp. AP-Ainpum-60-G11 TaxID=2576926 RepID=UPI001BFCDB9C|nr:NAD(P)-dependent oxidoreductase [Polynucleobacter sp. AP-Ainpum-60-G11]QWE27011.1 lactate dehydrogenase [Polynucleobacter sp. AP-Ainpum-60-G11]